MTTRAANTKPRKRRKDAGQPKELTEEHKRKMREAREAKKKEREKDEKKDLKETVVRLKAHVAKSERTCNTAYNKMRRSNSDKNFNEWIRADANLLNAITALRAHEQRLASER
jgi:hypothetical protein